MTLRIIAGRFKGRLLKTPKAKTTRPTQGMLREAVFNICQNEIVGARFLDLFAGSGAVAFEALSRGASHVTLVEQNRMALSCIQENRETLNLQSEVTIIPCSAERAFGILAKQGVHFDIVYIDPPYDLSIVDLESVLPLLAPNAILFLEQRYNPKKPQQTLESPLLKLKCTKRFGIALLSIYLISSPSE